MKKDISTEEVKTTAKETKSVSPKKATRSRDKSPEKKRKLTRKSLARKGPLVTSEIPGMHQRWFNDSVGRLDEAKELGYEHVLDENGEPKTRMTRSGNDVFKKFLMQTPDELFEEGQKEKAKFTAEQTAAMTDPDAEMGQYGEGLSTTKNK